MEVSLSQPVSPLFVHLPPEVDSLLERMKAQTRQPKGKLVTEAIKLLARSNLAALTKPPQKPQRKSAWLIEQSLAFFSQR